MAFCFVLLSCQKDTSIDNGTPRQANLKIYFSPAVDTGKLVFGRTYKNAFGEEYSITTFRFYIHGIELGNSQTNSIHKAEKSDHWLVNAADPASNVQLHISPSTYDRISFILGVDSIRNVSGAQTGALDPSQGMFWTWSTGYIMAKLEGNSPSAATPNNTLEYHIGGFKGTESVLRRITLDFPASQKVEVKQGSVSTIHIAANINSWFSGTKPIRISEKPVSMTPGSLAVQIADNYSSMFTVAGITNE
jgi:hypothetical protein